MTEDMKETSMTELQNKIFTFGSVIAKEQKAGSKLWKMYQDEIAHPILTVYYNYRNYKSWYYQWKQTSENYRKGNIALHEQIDTLKEEVTSLRKLTKELEKQLKKEKSKNV